MDWRRRFTYCFVCISTFGSVHAKLWNVTGGVGFLLPWKSSRVEGLDVNSSCPVRLHRAATEERLLTPIRVFRDADGDLKVALCALDWDAYSSNPPELPMFRDLVNFSGCNKQGNTRIQLLQQLLEEFRQPIPALKVLPPTGFIFHMSRVGSTLAANMLAVNPKMLVYSESHPPLEAIKLCDGCPEQEKVDLLRAIISLMGQSNQHQYLFFKFQSVATFHLKLFQTAFPDTPWIFVYREPVEVLMSHFQPFLHYKKLLTTRTRTGGSVGPKCSKQMNHPPVEIQKELDAHAIGTPSHVDYCAAHLASLCEVAYHALLNSDRLGKALEYTHLLEDFPTEIARNHFQLHNLSSFDIEEMKKISNVYSKSKKQDRPMQHQNFGSFKDDSIRKQDQAWVEIKLAANDMLDPIFQNLRYYSTTQSGL